ncbi:hypothetical protein [Thermoflavimicrobium daqui]|uniref:Uncharacterized protein n=1 Tax=Thermoflavimicrobium daqui TaxID=2137476 RepID=A0A364K2G2_9BACL|nr:hypothetical protein [Thermoflavimicrobium daqui]RAL22604.1 hypothetical protein DL897_14440 [Thermoflavimicrobium daqui]
MNYIRGVALAEDEKVIREYEAAQSPDLEEPGYLIVTDRRILLNSEKSKGKTNLNFREIKIDQVSGIVSYVGKKIDWGRILLAVILFIVLSIITSSLGSDYDDSITFMQVIFFLLTLGIPGYLIYLAVFKKAIQTELRIFCSNISVSPLGVSGDDRGFISRIFGWGRNEEYMSIIGIEPAKDTLQAMRELGALINDIQVLGGEAAYQKWSKVSFTNEKVITDSFTSPTNSNTNSSSTNTTTTQTKRDNESFF